LRGEIAFVHLPLAKIKNEKERKSSKTQNRGWIDFRHGVETQSKITSSWFFKERKKDN
jgi:hypothetical protein